MAALPDSLRALGADLLALACARGALAVVELQEEKARAERKFTYLALAALFLAAGMLLASLFVVVLFWDTHRSLAAAGVSLLHLGIGCWALLRVREMNQSSQSPFSATMGEFAHDLALSRGRSE
jgi:uncharacterized membrane protein YqjE